MCEDTEKLREVVVESVHTSLLSLDLDMIVLKEKEGGRHLPVWTGRAEAQALAARPKSKELPARTLIDA